MREVEEDAEATGDDDDDERRPRDLAEPPDDPQVEPHHTTDVQVEPGGETAVERNGRVTLESGDAEVDGEVARMRRDTQVEGKRAGTCREALNEGERRCSSARVRPTTLTKENGQRTSTDADDGDVPEAPPEPPPPPDKPELPQNEPRDVKLEGERKVDASFEDARTSDEADASGASIHDEDGRTMPKNLPNASEHIGQQSEQRVEQNSPNLKGAPDHPDEPGGESPHQIMPTGARNVLETCRMGASTERTRRVQIKDQGTE